MKARNPIEELHASSLFKFLHAKDAEYSSRITTFVTGIAPILATTTTYFPYYTRHDAHHGFRVTERMAQVLTPRCLDPENDESLLPAEVFLLIASAYAHDLGMTVFPGEERRLLDDLGFDKTSGLGTCPELQRYLRGNHSKRGGDYIHSNASALAIPQNLVTPLDSIMRSHNLSISELEQDLRTPFAAQERVMDVRQLAVVLCVADAIEFSDTRVVDGVLDLLKVDTTPAATVSYRENMKHVCIGDSVAVDNDGRIVVSGTFSEPDVLAMAHHTFDQMEEWIRGYSDIDRRSLQQRLRLRPEPFSRNLILWGARFERLGVRMSKKSVIDLIASNAIWQSDGGASIRELAQNAVEACRYRARHSTSAHNYVPQVRITFDRKAKTITVQDNGCGMSERTILNHFLTVGNSRAQEAAYSAANHVPIARFGIGFWSVFTIAERARIETGAFEDLPGVTLGTELVQGVTFDVALDNMKDYTVFVTKELRCGTRIVLTLRPDVVVDEVFDQARRHLVCSAVEIILFLDDEEFAVSAIVPSVSALDIFGARQRLSDELGIQTFEWCGSFGIAE